MAVSDSLEKAASSFVEVEEDTGIAVVSSKVYVSG